ncbi:MAG: DNA polymerase III subunit delta [Candidatus Peregrinibacteria bacterium]|nr:DNA polymerase III subunit delta [Candidatus Peregrinibacteria bacterium]
MKHIVLLYGEDQFGIREKLNLWKQAFTEKYGGDNNIDELDGKTPPNQIIEDAQALPFLAEKRLIIIKNFLSEQDKDNLKKLADLLEEIPETSALIFHENTAPDKRTSLFKKMQKSCRLEECKPMMGSLLVEWIQQKVKESGSEIDKPNATYLASLVGTDTWKLQNEIQKLSLYAAPAPITCEYIDELVRGKLDTSIFKLTDAIGQKKADEAIKIFHELVERGEAIPMIFSMLARQFRLLIQILDTKAVVSSASQIASKIKQHPYAVSSMLAQTKNFKLEELQDIYTKLIAIDRGLKTGKFRYTTNDQREYLLYIEKFIVQTCH